MLTLHLKRKSSFLFLYSVNKIVVIIIKYYNYLKIRCKKTLEIEITDSQRTHPIGSSQTSVQPMVRPISSSNPAHRAVIGGRHGTTRRRFGTAVLKSTKLLLYLFGYSGSFRIGFTYYGGHGEYLQEAVFL